MLGFFSPYKLVFELVALLALVAGICYGAHRFLEAEQKIGYDKAVAEYQAKLSIAQAESDKREQQLTSQIERAKNAAVQREILLRSSISDAISSSNSLHNALAHYSTSGLSTDTAAALVKSATTLATVLDSCQSKYIEMAAIADRHASDVKTLSDSWPVVANPSD